VEVRRGDARWRFVELPARRFFTLELDLRRDADPEMAAIAKIRDRTVQTQIREAVVRARIHIRPEQAERLREARLREALEKAGAFYVSSLQIKQEESVRSRISLGEMESLTPLDLLARYFESQDPPADPRRREQLLRLAEQLMREEEP
jgi:exonuclease SbcD